MFDIEKQSISFGRKPLPIQRWEVWFMCPFGVVDTLEEALAKCKSVDMDPRAVIIPVPVAIDEAGRYEIIVRG